MSITYSLKSSIEIGSSSSSRANSRSKILVSNPSILTLESQSDRRKKSPAVVEAVVISLAIIIVVALSSLPVIFFYLPTVRKKLGYTDL